MLIPMPPEGRRRDPILSMLASMDSRSPDPKEERVGIYHIGHFGSSDFLRSFEHYPDFDPIAVTDNMPAQVKEDAYEGMVSRNGYGVCDSVEQLLAHFPLDDDEAADNAMSDDDWITQFDPVMNADGSLFEISQSAENFQELVEAQRIWTMLDCDGSLYLSPGVHWDNRMSYHVTNKPWTNESVDVAWDVRDEDEDDNEEN